MKRISGIAATILAVALSGCTTVVVEEPRPLPPLPAPPPAQGSCFAEDAEGALGLEARTGVIERATLDSGARTARLIRPGWAYTQEFNPDRLNIEVDENNRIVRLTCG